MSMSGSSGPPARPKAKTPAERSEEFDAKQAQLRKDAAERRAAAAKKAAKKS